MHSFNLRSFRLFVLFLFFGFLLVASAQTSPSEKTTSPSDGDRVVISLGDVQVTAKEVEKLLEEMPANWRPFYAGPMRRQLADIIVNNKLWVKEAERRKLQDKEDIQLKLKVIRDSVLVNAAQNEIRKETTVSQKEAQKHLDDHLAEFEQTKARRIVICTQSSHSLDPAKGNTDCLPDQEARAKAEEIRKKLLEGADFDEMAARFSSDTMSAGKGGDLGMVRRRNPTQQQASAILITPPVEQVIFSTKEGSISEVIPSPFGYEIVKVEERRTPKLEEVRTEVEEQVRKRRSDELLKEIRKGYEVKIDEAYFAPKANTSSKEASQ